MNTNPLYIFAAIALVLACASVWLLTTPRWDLYHRVVGNATTLEEFDQYATWAQNEADEVFHNTTLDFSASRKYMEENLGRSYKVEAWTWIWSGSGKGVSGLLEFFGWDNTGRRWWDIWRKMDYAKIRENIRVGERS